MKKSLLKASLICLGITLLCGLYSFKTPDGVKLQQRYLTAAISNDTIITPEGMESQQIKEVVVESGLSKCTCTLSVVDGTAVWILQVYISCDCDVIVTYDYIVYYVDGTTYQPPYPVEIRCDNGMCNHKVEGSMSDSRCCPVSITARLAQE